MRRSKLRRRSFFPCSSLLSRSSRLSVGSAGRPHVPPPGLDQDFSRGVLVGAGHDARAAADAAVHSGPAAAGIEQSGFARHAGHLSADPEALPPISENHGAVESRLSGGDASARFSIGSQFMPPLFEGAALYMPTALPGISIGQATQLLQEQDRILRSFPEVESCVRLHRPFRQRDRQCAARYV